MLCVCVCVCAGLSLWVSFYRSEQKGVSEKERTDLSSYLSQQTSCPGHMHAQTHTDLRAYTFPSVILFSTVLPNIHTLSILKARSHPAPTECLCGLCLLFLSCSHSKNISGLLYLLLLEKQAKNRKNRHCPGWWG